MHSDIKLFPCPRCNSSNHRPVLLLHDHRIPLGANQILRPGWCYLALCTLSSSEFLNKTLSKKYTSVENRLCLPFDFLMECVLKAVLCCMKLSTCNAQISQSPVGSQKSRTMEPPSSSAMDTVLRQPMRMLKAEKVEGPESLQKAYSLLQPYYAKHLEVSLD